ncbi:MAG: hypothetical protein SGBAC_001788 [Bacillariaceae sp.]
MATAVPSSITQEYVLPKGLASTEDRPEWDDMLEEQAKYMKLVEDAFQALMECHDRKIRELTKWKEAHSRLVLELEDTANELSQLQEEWRTAHKRRSGIRNKSISQNSKDQRSSPERSLRECIKLKHQSQSQQHASTPNFPDHLLCPLTHEPFVDPVIDHEGNTYEKSAILEWLSLHPTSPLTRNHMTENQLIPNRAIKHATVCWIDNSSSSLC